MAALNTPAALDQSVYMQPLDFVDIYERNVFGGVESRSGNGASLEQTAAIRAAIPALFRELGVASVLDAPCGDFNWMKDVVRACPPDTLRYTGVDIVPDLIASNGAAYASSPSSSFSSSSSGSNTVSFEVADVINDPLPRADLVVCRDCLVHLRVEDALKAVANFRRSGARYLLSTTFPTCGENTEEFIRGLWRPLNLEKAPFDLGPALRLIDEKCTEVDFLKDKCLGLWDLQKLA